MRQLGRSAWGGIHRDMDRVKELEAVRRSGGRVSWENSGEGKTEVREYVLHTVPHIDCRGRHQLERSWKAQPGSPGYSEEI